MKPTLLLLAFCTTFIAHAAESTGDRIKSDAKAVGHGVKNAAVDVGRQIKHGSKKAYKGAKTKIKSDVKSGKPGDGTYARRNESMKNAKDGRD